MTNPKHIVHHDACRLRAFTILTEHNAICTCGAANPKPIDHADETIVHVIAVVNDDPTCPFHCGSQAVDWEWSNCHGCVHGGTDTDDDPFVWGKCAIRDAITCAYMGEWDPSVNEAMGYDGGVHPPAVCASREEAS